MDENNTKLTKHHIGEAFAGELLSDALAALGLSFPMPCGGHGLCGKCKVLLEDGRTVRACSFTVPADGVDLLLPDRQSSPSSFDIPQNTGCPEKKSKLVLDLGTTTLELAAVLPDGELSSSVTALNPEGCYGADVLSRITACENGKLDEMRGQLLKVITDMILRIAPGGAEELYVAGNPTMTHIFCGISPSSIGRYPFTTAFDGTKRMTGAELPLPVDSITVLPAASAYIGSDITAGILATGLPGMTGANILSDLGTNGETVLSCEGRLICASSAAGPALEGAGISCGTGGVPGAVCKVTLENGKTAYKTIDDAPASGLCGSGLCDLIAVYLETGLIDRTGRITSPSLPAIAPGIALTQKDIRAFQLAQSAVCATVIALSDAAGIDLHDVSSVILAGGLGSRIDPVSAVKTGIFPASFGGKISAAGNTALKGAAICASVPERLVELEEIAKKCETIDLNSSEAFAKSFISSMIFPG